MRRGLVLALLLAATIFAVVPADAGRLGVTSVGISGTASPGTGGTADLALTSNGPGAILYLRVQAGGGKQIDQASVNGQSCQFSSQGQAGCGPFNPAIASGQTFTMNVHSPQGLSPNDGPFVLYATENGRDDDGPFTVPYLPAEPVPCKCVELKVSVKKGDAYTAAGQIVPAGAKFARIGGLFRWTLTCTRGDGNCSGDITAAAPAKTDVKVKLFEPIKFVPTKGPYKGKTLYKQGKPIKGLTVTCSGPCTASSTGTFFLRADSANDLTPSERAGKTFAFSFTVVCGGKKVTQTISFVFKPNGDLDKKKSTLS